MNFPDLSGGLCREIGVEIFFPDVRDASDYQLARTICSGCGVREQCLEWAVRHEPHGMWGGTTPLERKQIRRKRKIMMKEILVKDFV